MKRYQFKPGQHIVPIGSRVRIKDHPGLSPRSLAGAEATVIGYDVSRDQPVVSCITQLRLEIPGDVTFKWPALFPWQVEILGRGWLTPRRWGRALRDWLCEPIQLQLMDLYECGWLDGGCRLLARGLQIWLGEPAELCGIRDNGHNPAEHVVQHIVTQVGCWYLDGDGVSSLTQLRRRWQRTEGLVDPNVGPLTDELLWIPGNEIISARLAQQLERRFDRRAVRSLLGLD